MIQFLMDSKIYNLNIFIYHSTLVYNTFILSPKFTTISLTLLLTLTNPINLSPTISALTLTKKSSSIIYYFYIYQILFKHINLHILYFLLDDYLQLILLLIIFLKMQYI